MSDTRAGASEAHPVHQVSARLDGAGFRTEIQSGTHRLIADEPLEVGGTDLGPNPYDLLLAALAACTVMTLRMYADHKGIPLEAVGVSLTHRKIHAQDCEDCESKSGRIDRIERSLQLEGDLTEAQRTRMTEIASRCPVHRTLTSETVIRTVLAPAPD
ncbi:MAG: OsmC family protein [Caldilineae bacterium]|nr:OsmC family protein [Chloroflexota bacterium]MCB9177764.1 OsmC family protein [Caldilineae bacterium]